MKLKIHNSKIEMMIFALLSLFCVSNIFGQSVGDYRSKNTSSANWSTLSTWDRYDGVSWSTPTILEGYPGENMGTGMVTITNNPTGTVVLDISPVNAISSLAIGDTDGVAYATLTFNSTEILNVTGNVTLLSAHANAHHKVVNLNAGVLNVGGNFRVGTGNQLSNNGARQSIVNISTGTLSIDGNLTLEAYSAGGSTTQALINVTGAGVINLKGNFTLPYSIGRLNMSGANSVFNYNGTTAQTILMAASQVRYRNLSINNTSVSGATLSAATTAVFVAGNLNVGNISSGSLLNTNNFAVNLAASISVNVAAGSTIDAGTSLFLLGASGTVTVNGTFKTANTAGFSGAAATAIRSANSPTVSLGSDSVIEYNAAANQTVTIRTYANVVLSNSGSKTIGNATIINKNLAINGAAIALLSNGGVSSTDTLTLGGIGKIAGSWGSTSSAATNTDNTYFTANTGIINVATSPCPTLSATIGGTDSICVGNSTAFSVNITGGVSPYTVVYSGGAGGTVSGYTSGSNITVNPTSTTTYTLTSVTDFNGCPATLSGTAVITVGITKTWTGIWTPSAPTSIDDAVISANYSVPADINACKLTIDSGAIVSIPSTYNVTLNGSLTVSSGSFTLENNANLLQSDGVTNSGNITVKRNSNALLRFDYTLWSSPVTGSQTLFNFSPLTSNTGPTNIRFYTYNPTSNLYNAVTTATTSTFDTGTGYLIRVPFNHPTAPAVWTGSFVGMPNNGPVTLTSLTSGLYYGIGNPYPSTIDADLFITANGLTDALYFWRKTNGATGSSYATYTLAGGASPAPGTGASPSSVIPNGIIQVGQGFIAKATSSTFSFTNAMRVADNANQFFRTTQLERNRIWLNLTNTSGFFSQTMIAYMTNATMGVDASIDGRYFNDSQTALTSIVNNAEYAVQGRALPFVTSDIVPLGFKSETTGTYSLSIDSVDGLFSSTNQVIYLRDNLTGTVHNLSAGGYTFSTLSGVFNSRFDVLFENSVLGVENPNFTANNVSVYNNNNELVINSTDLEIKTVKVFDIRGRLLVEKSNINANEARLNVGVSNQVLVVQITSTNNDIVVKKVVN